MAGRLESLSLGLTTRHWESRLTLAPMPPAPAPALGIRKKQAPSKFVGVGRVTAPSNAKRVVCVIRDRGRDTHVPRPAPSGRRGSGARPMPAAR